MSVHDHNTDWSRLWSSPAMLRLRKDRKAFFSRAWTAFAISFGPLLVVTAFFPDLTAQRLFHGMTVGLLLALSYVAVVMTLTALYIRRARRWDELAAALLASESATTPKETAHV